MGNWRRNSTLYLPWHYYTEYAQDPDFVCTLWRRQKILIYWQEIHRRPVRTVITIVTELLFVLCSSNVPSCTTKLNTQKFHIKSKELSLRVLYGSENKQRFFIPRITSFATRTNNINPRAQIRKYDAEDAFELLKPHDQLTLDHLVEIRQQSALEELEELQPEPEDRSVTVQKLTEWASTD